MRTSLFAVALSAVIAVTAGAQNGFLFHAPEARISVRGGYALATAGSDIFDFATSNLTLNKGDFSGLTLGANASFAVSDRFDIGADVDYSRTTKGSEFRHFSDNHDQPIAQNTVFERVPLMATARYYLSPPGRSIGKLAWIPTRTVPWIGVGGGAMYYRFEQVGDFVDFQTLNVFPGTFKTESWAPAAQVMGGIDFSLTPLVALTTDARYLYASGSVNRDFSGFNRIDLSGASVTVGLTFRL